MRFLPILLLCGPLLLQGCTKGCGSDDPTPKADEKPRTATADGENAKAKSGKTASKMPDSVPKDACDDFCQNLCAGQLRIPCAEKDGRFIEFSDIAACEDNCLDRCEKGRATYLANGCLQSTDCYVFFDCAEKAIRAANGGGTGSDEAGKGKAGKAKAGKAKAGRMPEDLGDEPLEEPAE